ncbi:Na+-dependent transporter [Herbaspirillum sp. HC18]|nr:Na+-dependent transporter [Herbaspirillum sp. HC18]
METLKEIVPLALYASLFLVVLGVGLDASVDDAVYVLRQPKLLLRSLIPISIIVPAFATLLAAVLPLKPIVEVAILLMAVSPLPPFLPGKGIRLGGRKPYVYGLLVAVSLLSIVIVPVSVAIIAAGRRADVSISPDAVAGVAFKMAFLPLAVGMTIRRFWPSHAQRAAPVAGKVGMLVLVISLVPLVAAHWSAMAELIGNGSIAAIVAVVVVGLVSGHMLGGPDPLDRVTLAISSALRHPGIALLIAGANSAEPNVKAAILLFLLVGLLTEIPYRIWYKRHNPVLPLPTPERRRR